MFSGQTDSENPQALVQKDSPRTSRSSCAQPLWVAEVLSPYKMWGTASREVAPLLEQFTAAQREQLEPHWQRAFAFVEKTLGGRIVRSGVHPRWRPAYYLDVEVDGEIVPLYFRGDRGDLDHGVYTLEHEARVLIALERNGIPVPHVYGFCEDPLGIVMARVEGRPDLSTAETPEEASRSSTSTSTSWRACTRST